MARQPHYLKTVKGGNQPSSILCCAVAGQLGKGGVWSTHHYAADDYATFDQDWVYGTTAAAFWGEVSATVQSIPGTWIVFCEATSQLSELGFWDLLEEGLWEVEDIAGRNAAIAAGKEGQHWQGLCVVEDAPTIIVARKARTRRACTIIDIRNYGVGGWQSLFAGPLPSNDRLAEAKSKSLALHLFITELINAVRGNKLGSLRTTAASQAMHSYRFRFLRSMVLCHGNLVATGLERAALYGGRNECLHLGQSKGLLYHLDFNSFYPAVVVGEMMPSRLAGHVLGCKPDPRELAKNGYLCISEVTLDASEPRYPLRFSRDRHGRSGLLGAGGDDLCRARGGDLLYPVGRFTTALCGPELSVAFANDEVKRIHATSWYEPSELFTQWSCELAILEDKVKASGNRALREWVKRLRNSLFGKFGQWGWSWQPAPWQGTEAPYCSWYGLNPKRSDYVRYRALGWSVQYEERSGETAESCPAITAWVYSLARVRLLKALECAGFANVSYMDADSIWCNHAGYAALLADGWLSDALPGKLKLKGLHQNVEFHGLKMYTYDGVTIACGVPHGTKGNHREGWRYESAESVKSALANDVPPGQRTVTNVVKCSGVYRHGVRTVGGRVIPYTFAEE